MQPTSLMGTLAASLLLLSTVNAHGYVQFLDIGGKGYHGHNPSTPGEKLQPNIKGIGLISQEGSPQRPTANKQQGPANLPPTSLTALLATGGSATESQISVPAKGGDVVTVYHKEWPTGHYGVSWNMMADCKGPCKGKKGEDLEWFKISEEGYDAKTHTWPTTIMKTAPYGYLHSFTLPTNLKSGEYLLSTTLLALHSNKAPQYYPTAWQIKLESSGNTDPSPKMKIPDMYLKDNDATNFNIWQDDHTKFKVPGPAVYKGSDSVAGNSAAPRTDDIIPCNCAEGPDASAGPGTPDQDKLVPRTSTPAGSATDCGADYNNECLSGGKATERSVLISRRRLGMSEDDQD